MRSHVLACSTVLSLWSLAGVVHAATGPATTPVTTASGCPVGHTSDSSAFDCATDAICLDWPLVGQASEDWVVGNYFDQDRAKDSTADYYGEALTYDGHKGIDIALHSMRWVDYGVDVVAAADGRVIATDDGHEDRHVVTDETALANYVTVRHDVNGYVTKYYHLKKGSVAVAVGDRVKAGTVLGQAASSGVSNGPHLHFQVEVDGTAVDPFAPWLFSDCEAPKYQRPFVYNETSLQLGPIDPVDVTDPPLHDQLVYRVGDTLGIGLVSAGGNGSVPIESRVFDADGDFVDRCREVPDDSRSTWNGRSRKACNIDLEGTAGVWRVVVVADGARVESKYIYVGH